MASVWVGHLSLTWAEMSFNKDCKTSPAEEVYPPFNLLNVSSHIFQDSCAVACSPVSSGRLWKIGFDGRATSSCNLHGVDVKPPWTMSTNLTCLGWWLKVKVVSSVSMSPNNPLFSTGAMDGESKATTAPHFVFTVLGIKLNTSSLIASNWALGWDGVVLGSLAGLLGLVNYSMAFHCFPPKAISIRFLGFGP